MTIEAIKSLGIEELEARAAEIVTETAEADAETIEALGKELDAIEERKADLKREAAEKRAAAAAVASGAGKKLETGKDESKMTVKEVRSSQEYIEAFAKYVRTGKDAECRAILSENANIEGSSGPVPVPTFVESRVRQAWENDEIFSRISKTFVPGNLKVGFEISATDADVHNEGFNGPEEERLILGIVNMVPQNIKKWITVSDEVLALSATDFLTYLYDELTYKIIKKAADIVVQVIIDSPANSSNEGVGVPQIEGDITPENILKAIAKLGDGATDRVIIASGETIANVRVAALNANYAYDPFFGLTVIQKDNVEGAIIGDLSGVQANLPEGETVTFKFDDLSLAEKDLVKIVGRLYAAIAVVGPKMFAVIKLGGD